MKVLKVFMKPFRTFFRLKEMGKLSVLKGSAERSERFFSGLPLMYDEEVNCAEFERTENLTAL